MSFMPCKLYFHKVDKKKKSYRIWPKCYSVVHIVFKMHLWERKSLNIDEQNIQYEKTGKKNKIRKKKIKIETEI